MGFSPPKTRSKESRQFFFEKKNQKNFGNLRVIIRECFF